MLVNKINNPNKKKNRHKLKVKSSVKMLVFAYEYSAET